MLFNKVFTNTVSGFEQGWWGAKYLLVLLVLVVNQEQAIVVQLLQVTLPALALFILLKLCLVHPCLQKHTFNF